MLILERLWTRQPQGPVGVNWGNPMTRGLSALFSPGFGLVDVVAKQPFLPFGSIITEPGQFGLAAKFAAANSAYERTANDVSPTTEVTIFCLNYVLGVPSATANFVALTSSSDSGVVPYVAAAIKFGTGLRFGYSFGGSYASIDAGIGVSSTVGQSEFMIGRGRGGQQNIRYYINNSLFASADGTTAGTLSYSAGRRFTIGEDYRLASRNGNRKQFIAGIFNRYLQDAEVESLKNNPWQLFAPQRIYIPTAAAAASSLPTLSLPTYVTGSITATGARGRVTATAP